MREGEYVESLIAEYATLLRARPSKGHQSQQDEVGVVEDLTISSDWSARGAHELVRLADEYGAFMLRNALAIAVVLGKEDGTQGF
jgi:hypothetical protein